MKAMIFAAGMGTRFKPWTDKHPKALALVGGKSLLQRNIEYLQAWGIWEVIVNVHHFASQVEEAVQAAGGWGSKVTISDETGELLETGGGLKKAGPFFDSGPFVVINADILTDLRLSRIIDYHLEHRPLASLACTTRSSSRNFLFNRRHELCGWRNSATGAEKIVTQMEPLSPRAFSGIHLIEPSIFSLITLKGKFSMVDLYLDLAKTQKILSFDHSGDKLIDVGRIDAIDEAERLFK
jgi:N-acetyl-alpha-D-muramate 1-phosphate uridylyltransferase